MTCSRTVFYQRKQEEVRKENAMDFFLIKAGIEQKI